MASFENFLTRALNTLNPDKSAGKILMALNALGIGFAAASNTFAAATDKNTSAEDKKFLVPAGGVTGLANLGIYFGMTSKLVNKLEGKFANTVIDNMLQDSSKFTDAAKIFIDKKILKESKGKTAEFIESMTRTLKDENGNLTPYARSVYTKSISKGLGVLGAFTGAVIGCAIITPILRDVSAYLVQKAREAKNPSLKDKPYRPYFDISHVRAGQYPYGKPNNQPLSMRNYMAFTNGRTRI